MVQLLIPFVCGLLLSIVEKSMPNLSAHLTNHNSLCYSFYIPLIPISFVQFCCQVQKVVRVNISYWSLDRESFWSCPAACSEAGLNILDRISIHGDMFSCLRSKASLFGVQTLQRKRTFYSRRTSSLSLFLFIFLFLLFYQFLHLKLLTWVFHQSKSTRQVSN